MSSIWLLAAGESALRAPHAWVGVLLVALVLSAGCSTVAEPSPAFTAADAGGGSPTGDASFPFDANACHPGDVTTFAPTAYIHANPSSEACGPPGPGPADAIFEACFSATATRQNCVAAAARNSACWQCIETPGGATSYGPVLVDTTGFVRANVAGCIERSNPAALSCAKAAQASAECGVAACELNCPVIGDPIGGGASLTAYTACTERAELAGCQGYASAASPGGDACKSFQSVVTQCSPSAPTGADASATTPFQTYYRYAVALFCQTAPPDAASPVVDAASGDATVSPDDASHQGDSSSADASPGGGDSAPAVDGASSADASGYPRDGGED